MRCAFENASKSPGIFSLKNGIQNCVLYLCVCCRLLPPHEWAPLHPKLVHCIHKRVTLFSLTSANGPMRKVLCLDCFFYIQTTWIFWSIWIVCPLTEHGGLKPLISQWKSGANTSHPVISTQIFNYLCLLYSMCARHTSNFWHHEKSKVECYWSTMHWN